MEGAADPFKCHTPALIQAFIHPTSIGIKIDDFDPNSIEVIFLIRHLLN